MLKFDARKSAKPAASHDFDDALPPYNTRLRTGTPPTSLVSQNDFNTGLSVGAGFAVDDVTVEVAEGFWFFIHFNLNTVRE